MLHKPKTKPQDYGFKKGDTHIVVNASQQVAKIFSFEGTLIKTVMALATGQSAKWWVTGGDTPPSVYKLGTLYNDKANGNLTAAYGWMFFDLVDLGGKLEDGEDANGRSGLGLHGGGSSAPHPNAGNQGLYPTLGCIRMLNQDLENVILPLYKKGTVFVSVYQDDK